MKGLSRSEAFEHCRMTVAVTATISAQYPICNSLSSKFSCLQGNVNNGPLSESNTTLQVYLHAAINDKTIHWCINIPEVRIFKAAGINGIEGCLPGIQEIFKIQKQREMLI